MHNGEDRLHSNTVAINRANELNATALLSYLIQLINLWQHYGDVMEWAWTSSENNAERVCKWLWQN